MATWTITTWTVWRVEDIKLDYRSARAGNTSFGVAGQREEAFAAGITMIAGLSGRWRLLSK